MSAPLGLGWWTAFEGAAHAGPKARDLETLVDRCKRTGASWVAPRAGDASGSRDADFDRASCEAYAAAGLDVYPWFFDRAGAREMATALAKASAFRDWPGVRGVIINAEFEVVHAPASEAREKVQRLRDAGYDFVAHAPPDYLGGRGATPYLVALDEACDAIMPQVYAWEHNDAGHVSHLDQVRALYQKRGVPLAKVWPILCSYRPKFRGFTKEGKPIPTPPMLNEAQRVADDLVAGLDHEWTRSSQAPSIYSLDAVTFINGPSDRVIATLEARVGKPRRRVDDVTERQRALAALGHDPGKIDGIDGQNTRAALSRFASSRALSGQPSGVVLDALEHDYLELSNIDLPADPRGTQGEARAVVSGLFPHESNS